ncbi:MAG: hypothetical protein NT007_07895 [Candidatus Kapabacteria bacterium]|nr:hypothetical protein [Candidatus Kapabacteria bacterium]
MKSITYLTILDTKELTFPKEIIDLEKLSSIDLENIGFVSFKFKLPKSLMGIRIFESNFISFDDNVEYHKLKYLSLDIEKMEKIPDNIDKFESIEEIGIGCEPMNKLLELNNFNFKSILELKKVKGLKKFSLGGVNLNNFGIPKEIFELSTIEELDLSSDSLNALVPEMTQLTNLKKLNLPWNQFKEVPKILCEMKKLEKVDLNYNEIRNKNVKIDVGRCKEIDISIEFNK